MEEEKLLRFLKYITSITAFLLISSPIAYSELKVSNFKRSGTRVNSDYYVQKTDKTFDDYKLHSHLQLKQDKEWLGSLSWEAKDITISNILEKLKELSAAHLPLANKFTVEELENPKVTLQIFVSSSMPISLLKSYYKEAQKFSGILVFNGLPNGSFVKLTKLVMEIAEDNVSASMQIDDSAFTKYNVKSVPTIVLSKEKDCWLENCNQGLGYNNQSSSNYQVSDQMSGNVSISYALSQFALLGELQKEANELLK